MTNQKPPRLYLDDEEINRATREYMRLDSRKLAKDTLVIAIALLILIALMALILLGVALLVNALMAAGNSPTTTAVIIVAAGVTMVGIGWLLGREGKK